MKKILILAISCLANTSLWAVSPDSLPVVSENGAYGDSGGDSDGDSGVDANDSSEDSPSQDTTDAQNNGADKNAPYQNGAYVPLQRNTPWMRPDIEVSILAGGTGSYIPVNESLIDTSGVNSPSKYRFHLSGEGFSGGGSIGPMWRRGNHSFGAVMTGYVDTHTLKNYDHKNDAYSNDVSSSMTLLNRAYTLEFAAKVGHYFNDLHLYGKLGFMCSAFHYKYRNIDDNVDARKSMTAWGGVAGVGLQTPISLPVLNEAKIGLEYDYQLYQSLKPVIRYGTHKDTSKFRPRYHSGYLTLSKTF